jgi:transcription antitermination factor NusG
VEDNVDSDRGPVATNWCAVFTKPRHEKRVSEHFQRRSIESFLPLFRARHKWADGSVRTVQLPLFPGYIFVRHRSHERISVLEVPGVVRIIGNKREPHYISANYIRSLEEGLQQGKIEPHPAIAVGARVRIRVGVMAGTEGILKIKKRSCRVVLNVEMMMQSIGVEVALDDIEAVGPGGCDDLYQQELQQLV